MSRIISGTCRNRIQQAYRGSLEGGLVRLGTHKPRVHCTCTVCALGLWTDVVTACDVLLQKKRSSLQTGSSHTGHGLLDQRTAVWQLPRYRELKKFRELMT